ncbi:MAG: hypothetical protein EOP51_03355 [Sphingobacteriales bacterium]|nr:MAG: hypothetical protein EOP51_03355 [Sphingobacteriales bacterium]
MSLVLYFILIAMYLLLLQYRLTKGKGLTLGRQTAIYILAYTCSLVLFFLDAMIMVPLIERYGHESETWYSVSIAISCLLWPLLSVLFWRWIIVGRDTK